MTSRPVSRARALRKAFARQWRRVRADPRLLPHFAGKAWRILRGGKLDKLIERALEVSGERTKKAAVTKALEEFIARRRQKRLLDLMGKLEWEPSYDYKAERRRD